MSLSFQRPSNLYKYEEILHVNEKICKGFEIRYIDKDYALQFDSPQYHQPHEDQDEDLNNDEVEHVIPHYAKIRLKTKDLGEQVFTTKEVYQ